jgi:hypothetical protein
LNIYTRVCWTTGNIGSLKKEINKFFAFELILVVNFIVELVDVDELVEEDDEQDDVDDVVENDIWLLVIEFEVSKKNVEEGVMLVVELITELIEVVEIKWKLKINQLNEDIKFRFWPYT